MALLSWLNADHFSALRDKVNAIISVSNSYGLGNGDSASVNNILIPLGAAIPYFGNVSSPNSSFLLANGQAISRTTYSALFALIGTNYGIGNGSTTFNIPDIKGKTLVGYDPFDSDFNALTSASSGGEKAHRLITSEIPSHTHSYIDFRDTAAGGIATGGAASISSTSQTTAATGGDGAHNNLQPYITTNYLIRVL